MVFAWYGWIFLAAFVYLFGLWRTEREKAAAARLAVRIEEERRLREMLKTATGYGGLKGGSYRHGKG